MVESLIETARLNLVILDASFAPLVLAYYQKNKEHFQNSMPLYPPKFLTADFQQLLLEQQSLDYQEGRLLKLYFFKKEDIDYRTIVGDLSLNNIIRGALQSCHLGYKLDKDFLNQGFMSEAIAAVIKHAFQEMKLHRMEANIMPFNTPSVELAEKIGFKKEGFSTDYLKINGKWENHLRYAILSELEV